MEKEMQANDGSQNELMMESQLSEIPQIIERLRADPEVFSRIQGREVAFLIAMREALTNAITHGNHYDILKKVFIRYVCEADGALSIMIRDEGEGFDPTKVPTPKNIGEDLGRGICLMKSCMDEVQFRKNGTEVHMRMQSTIRSDKFSAVTTTNRIKAGLTHNCRRNITEFVRSRINEDIRLSEMAAVAGLSVSHFSHMFRQSVGESPHQFVLRQRVQYAKEMLLSWDVRMIDVALACGFKTQQHFARIFRKVCGISPTEYRRLKLRKQWQNSQV
jgi:AraC-like DNA-binding protein